MKKRGARSGEQRASTLKPQDSSLTPQARLLAVCERLADYMDGWLSPTGRQLRDELVEAMAAVQASGSQLPAPSSQLDHEGQS